MALGGRVILLMRVIFRNYGNRIAPFFHLISFQDENIFRGINFSLINWKKKKIFIEATNSAGSQR